MNRNKLIGKGRTAEVYEIEENKVVKLFYPSTSKDSIEREYKITKFLNDQNLNVPIVYDLIEFEKRIGIVYENISGISLTKMFMRKPWTYRSYAQLMADLHYQTHIETSECLTLFKDSIKHCIHQIDDFNDNTKNKLLNLLDSLSDGTKICHGDFHPDNIIVNNEKIVVLDWMTAAIGDPISDVARSLVILKFTEFPDQSKLVNKIIKFFINRFAHHYLLTYVKLSRTSLNNLNDWMIVLAAARLVENLSLIEKDRLRNFVLHELKHKNLSDFTT